VKNNETVTNYLPSLLVTQKVTSYLKMLLHPTSCVA